MDRGGGTARPGGASRGTRNKLRGRKSQDSESATFIVKPVRLSTEAADELEKSADWYGARGEGLAVGFLEEFERVASLIGSRPASFPRLHDVAPELEIRRALLPRFPYALVFLDLGPEVRIIAVAHAKRRPGYWLHRVAEAGTPQGDQ